ncbi:MAG: hypothetical protein AB1704_28380 [Pseudomonadota bacterium]
MKKAILACAALLVALGATAPAHADDHYHHRVCHKVHVHGHWERHCH